jgi:lysophospholipase L1-like esterase
MSLALKLMLAPVLVTQALTTRRRAPVLPEADGPRQGRIGSGRNALRLLIAGDSSAAGVGVVHQDQAFAGHLTRELHRRTSRPVRFSLHARSGLTTQQVHALLLGQRLLRSDLAVVVTGVNDVLELVTPRRAVQHRERLADWLLSHAGVAHVIFTPLPPMHRFPLLPQPLKRIMGDDARAHNDALARWAALRDDVSFVPIELELAADHMAHDGFHPGEPVYRHCGESVAAFIASRVNKETKS